MKCFYYLSPTLAETGSISDDLQKSGVNHWFIHIFSKNEAGITRLHLHSSNYLESMDLLRNGLIGAAIGFIVSLLFIGILVLLEPFGPNLPLLPYLGVILLLTCFGAWQGGLIGISAENKKLQPFSDEIAAGKHLILVYASRKAEEKVHATMSRLHPAARLVGTDPQFYNPFSDPKLV